MKFISKGFGYIRKISIRRKGAVAMIVIIAVVGFYIFIPKNKPPTYQTVRVERGTVISTIAESGNIASASQIGVTSPTTGIVEAVYVKNGDTVSDGQNLFEVKSSASASDKASAYANYLSAQNSLNSAQAKLNSLQSAEFKANQTFMNDAVANNLSTSDPKYIEEDADWRQAEADYKNQTGVIAQAQAALFAAALSNAEVSDAVVTAPAAGTVANLSVDVGSSVTGSGAGSNSSNSHSSSTPATPVLILGNFSNLVIVAPVNEIDIPSVKVGQNAVVKIDSIPNKMFAGKVTNIDSIGTSNSGVVTYNVTIKLIAPPSDVKPGMTTSVTIETARHDNVLVVPNTAVQTVNGNSYVSVLKNGKSIQIPVTIGIASDTETEITSGLSEGKTVITSAVPSSSASSSQGSPFSPFGGGFRGGNVRVGGPRVGRGVIFRGGGG